MKKILVLCLSIIFLLGFAACGNNADPSETVTPAPGERDWTAVYNVVISQYKEIIEKGDDLDSPDADDFRARYNHVNLILANSLFRLNVYYALYDINGDGIPELIIAGGMEISGGAESGTETLMTFHDIFTYYDGNVINVFEEIGHANNFGSRINLSICESGVIHVEWADGFARFNDEFFRISEAGHVELIEKLWVDSDLENFRGVYMHYYGSNYSEADNLGREISESEYSRILERYENSRVAIDFDWIRIYVD